MNETNTPSPITLPEKNTYLDLKHAHQGDQVDTQQNIANNQSGKHEELLHSTESAHEDNLELYKKELAEAKTFDLLRKLQSRMNAPTKEQLNDNLDQISEDRKEKDIKGMKALRNKDRRDRLDKLNDNLKFDEDGNATRSEFDIRTGDNKEAKTELEKEIEEREIELQDEEEVYRLASISSVDRTAVLDLEEESARKAAEDGELDRGRNLVNILKAIEERRIALQDKEEADRIASIGDAEYDTVLDLEEEFARRDAEDGKLDKTRNLPNILKTIKERRIALQDKEEADRIAKINSAEHVAILILEEEFARRDVEDGELDRTRNLPNVLKAIEEKRADLQDKEEADRIASIDNAEDTDALVLEEKFAREAAENGRLDKNRNLGNVLRAIGKRRAYFRNKEN